MEENKEFEAEIPDGAPEMYVDGSREEHACDADTADGGCTVGEAMASASLEEAELQLREAVSEDAVLQGAEVTEDGEDAEVAEAAQSGEGTAAIDTLEADMEALRSAFPDLSLTAQGVMNRERYAALRAAGASPAEAFAATNTAALMGYAQAKRAATGAGKAHLVGVAHKSGSRFAPTMSAAERRIAREFFGDGFSDRELDKLYAKAVRGA